ncbi:hypothetical protein AKN87_11560 [Thiopseudomonas alkaliphila]|nr:hypothetical protein AKN87_11560 [Thiopseudomonas alkaliphila]
MMASLGVVELWAYVIGTVLIVLLPGPNSLFVLSTAVQRGVAAGYRAAAGVFIGDSLLMLFSALGMASLLKTHPMLFDVFKMIGAAYLGYLGLRMLVGAWRTYCSKALNSKPAVAATEPSASHKLSHPLRKALVLSLSNPKAILFFMSFFIQFVDPGYAYPGVSFLVLGIILQVISLLYLTVLIFMGARLAHWFAQRKRIATGAGAAVGTLFVGFGVKLATATLS